jgi:hypothetical protein
MTLTPEIRRTADQLGRTIFAVQISLSDAVWRRMVNEHAELTEALNRAETIANGHHEYNCAKCGKRITVSSVTCGECCEVSATIAALSAPPAPPMETGTSTTGAKCEGTSFPLCKAYAVLPVACKDWRPWADPRMGPRCSACGFCHACHAEARP